MTDVSAVGVVGAGTMGAGIAQLLAQNRVEVRLYDVSEAVLSAAEGRILKGLERREDPAAFSLVRKTTRLEDLGSCDLAIEAVTEDLAAKRALFRALDSLLEPPKVLATNTSSLSVAAIASATENPDRVVGMHFFNPAPIMRLVEIVRAPGTGAAALEAALELSRRLGKTPVVCRDTPGFVANRVVRPFYLSGMRLLEAGAGDPEDIDRALREQGGFRMGPFELMDLIGLDVNLTISRVVYEALGRPERLRPCAVQERLVAMGQLGRKTGRGFYLHGGVPAGTLNPRVASLVPGMGAKALPAAAVFRRVLEAVLAEAKLAESAGVAPRDGIDTALRLGMNWPKGPFEWEKQLTGRR